MATEAEYYAAFAKVRAGTAKSNDHHLTTEAAKQAGAMGRAARDALANADDSKS